MLFWMLSTYQRVHRHDQSTTQIYSNTNPTYGMVIKYLHSVLSKIVGKDQSSAEDPENEDPTETFETPDMEEVLRENQTADEL